jgi:hypothetical protein
VVCPIVLAVVALVFADRARAEIAGSGGWVTGDGMVTAAKVVAWVNIAVFLAIGLMVAAGLVWAAVMVNVTAS